MRLQLDLPAELERLEARIRSMLPPLYQRSYESVQPVSMGSAALRYDEDGRIAWDRIWGSFCDLAMAGGPPHRGTLLQPGGLAQIAQEPALTEGVLDELCRGLSLVTGLHAQVSTIPGWVRMDCTSAMMAEWLARAIVVENVSARFDGLALLLPAGPAYRPEKEIKNVVTAVAKTCHYWLEHMSYEQHGEIGRLLRAMKQEAALLQPLYADEPPGREVRSSVAARVAALISGRCGLHASPDPEVRWLRVQREDVPSAVWMVRALCVCNVMARSEDVFVCVPVNPVADPEGERLAGVLEHVYRLELYWRTLHPKPLSEAESTAALPEKSS